MTTVLPPGPPLSLSACSTRHTVFFSAADSVAQAVVRFDSLCKLILKFPELASSAKFVFVPGPQDPGAGDTLPRPPVRREERGRTHHFCEGCGATVVLVGREGGSGRGGRGCALCRGTVLWCVQPHCLDAGLFRNLNDALGCRQTVASFTLAHFSSI